MKLCFNFYTSCYYITTTYTLDVLLLQVNTLLEESTVWKEYKEQKHDLFLTSTQTAGYLTGPVGVAGYLTAGPSTTASTMSGLPPPLEPPDHADDNTDDK